MSKMNDPGRALNALRKSPDKAKRASAMIKCIRDITLDAAVKELELVRIAHISWLPHGSRMTDTLVGLQGSGILVSRS
jgi:hypothetical protein